MFIQLYAVDVDQHTSTLQSVDRHSLLKTDIMSINLTCRSIKKICTRHVDTMYRLIARHAHRHIVGSVDTPLHYMSVPTLLGTGRCYELMLRCYTLTLRCYTSTLVCDSIILQCYITCLYRLSLSFSFVSCCLNKSVNAALMKIRFYPSTIRPFCF